jgi:hypothetical protein
MLLQSVVVKVELRTAMKTARTVMTGLHAEPSLEPDKNHILATTVAALDKIVM